MIKHFMNTLEQIISHSRCLSEAAQREVLDFIQFLEYKQLRSHQLVVEKTNKLDRSIRENPAFGMWNDINDSSREYLNKLRQQQYLFIDWN
jgi:hypothetical protein